MKVLILLIALMVFAQSFANKIDRSEKDQKISTNTPKKKKNK